MYLWIDTETTGLKPGVHGVIQIGAIITDTLRGGIIGEFNENCHNGDFEIDEEAMKVNNIIVNSQFKKRQSPEKLLRKFVKFLNNHVDKFDKNDKLIPVGYNVRFDLDMLFSLSEYSSYKYLGAYISGSYLDILQRVRFADAECRIGLSNHRLANALSFFNIPNNNSHDALADIKATRKLYIKMLKKGY